MGVLQKELHETWNSAIYDNLGNTLVSSTVCLAVFIFMYSEYKYSSIRQLYGPNMGGPFAWPIIGNLNDFLFKPAHFYVPKYVEKYGNLFMMFIGPSPRLMIADAKVIRQISTKDFDVAPNHDIFAGITHKYSHDFVIQLKDTEWKKVRAMMSPTFTSSKIKIMYKLLDKCGDDIVECIGERIADIVDGKEARAVLPLKQTYQLFSLDAIASCCYALKLHRQKGETTIDAMAKRSFLVRSMLAIFVPDKLHLILSFILPEFLRKHLYLNNNMIGTYKTAEILQPIIDERRKTVKKYNDYLQILVDAKIDDEMVLNKTDSLEDHHAGLTKDLLLDDQQKIIKDYLNESTSDDVSNNSVATKKTLTDIEIIANAIFLLFVGLETTSSSLTIVTYSLAMHQDCQQRLYEELKKIARKADDGSYKFEYEELTACAYLDSVICESLRIHSPVPMIDRSFNQDYRIEEYNVTVPKNTPAFFLVQHVQRNPEFWPQPLKFEPERFMPENRASIVPGSYAPFGQGPRHCLGMRFSLTETKLALAKIIMNFKFTPKPDSVWPLKVKAAISIANFLNTDVFVERRLD